MTRAEWNASRCRLSPEGERKARLWLLNETIRLRDRLRERDPQSQRLPIAEKDVMRQCRELGVPYVE